ncbi:PEP-CTERM sorting domain-containing protein [Cellvibrio sp. ARAG 10.3]|uniref:PEP-CTERM sorting domain-containing protein n=1 Tax=Cellvibrio sp. ARAG 10.3 TaxID=3451358 RepID=UPI003F484A55
MYKLLSAFCFLVLTALSLNASAALIQYDWKTEGDNGIILDDVSGLEWLDLDQSGRHSYNEMEDLLASGGALEGFRFATVGEFEGLLQNNGINPSLCLGFRCAEQLRLIDQLIRIMGAEYAVDSVVSYMHAFILSEDQSEYARGIMLRAVHVDSFVNIDLDRAWSWTAKNHSLLVRATPVPAPGTLGLLFISLVSLAVLRRRQTS